MRRRRVVVAALGAIVAGGLTLSACGIPTQPSASPISASQSQASLPPTRPQSSPCAKSGCFSVDVYFVSHTGRLAPVGRVVPRDAKLATVIRALISGPTPPEIAQGMTTALGAGIHLLSAVVTTRAKTATLDFNVDFGTLSGTQEVLGVAQVVDTVTAFIPDAGVTFEIAGGPIEVPIETGLLVTTAVHESQYGALRTTTTTTTTTS